LLLTPGEVVSLDLDTGGKLQCACFDKRNVKSISGLLSRAADPLGGGQAVHNLPLSIEIHEVKCLPDSQLIGKQDPYLVATTTPSEGGMSARTQVCPNGDTNPVWHPDMGSVMGLKPQAEDKQLLLQVWNQNLLVDSLLGSTSIPLEDIAADPTRMWLQLDNGGLLESTLRYVMRTSWVRHAGSSREHAEVSSCYPTLTVTVTVTATAAARLQSVRPLVRAQGVHWQQPHVREPEPRYGALQPGQGPTVRAYRKRVP
jgi:hypothetical protein